MGLDCSPSRVQRFTTQTEGHKPVAGAPVLISRRILLFPSHTSDLGPKETEKDQPP